MRNLALPTLALLATLAVSACATAGAGSSTSDNSRRTEMDRLRQSCDSRGGILTPSGRSTGEVALDNVCNLHGTPRRP